MTPPTVKPNGTATRKKPLARSRVLERANGSSVIVRRDWSHLKEEQVSLLTKLFTHPLCHEICTRNGFKHHNVLGMAHPPFITEKNVLELRAEFETLPTDIFVCTYPKCGTQWVLSILKCMRSGGQPIEKGFEARLFPWPERIGLEATRNTPGDPRLFKIHAPVRLLPWKTLHPKTKVIYCTRNPKDCVVSFHKHATQGNDPGKLTAGEFSDYTGGFNDFFELFMDGRLPFGDYFEHTASWHQFAMENPDQVFWLSFEDLKANPDEEMTRLAKFVGMPHDPATIERVRRETTFKKLKSAAEGSGHFRKGIVGDWQNHLSPAQSKRLDEKLRVLLHPLGLHKENV